MSAIMITGYTGTRHIRPSMDAAVYRGAFGNENYVLSEDDNCEGSMPSVNEFVVADGCVSMQGHAVQIKLESLDVDTCATGYARIDLVCCRFTHNTSSLIDNAELVVIKGDEVADSNTPQPPAYSEGIIDEGATQVDFPMYKITMHGGTVTFEQMFTLIPSLDGAGSSISDIKSGWKYQGSATGTTTVTVPDSAVEVFIVLGTSTNTYRGSSPIVDTSSRWLIGGYYASSSDWGYGNVNITNSGKTYQIRNYYYGGAAGSATMYVYYK